MFEHYTSRSLGSAGVDLYERDKNGLQCAVAAEHVRLPHDEGVKVYAYDSPLSIDPGGGGGLQQCIL